MIDAVDQEHCMSLLEPHFGSIHQQFIDALALYNGDYPAHVRAEHTDSVAAHSVWCHAFQGFERAFCEIPGFHFLTVRGLRLINMRDELIIRIKKVDENGRHQNHDSKQQRDFDRQKDLPGLPQQAVRLVVGYQPDPAFSKVERVIVRNPSGGWAAQIIESYQSSYSWTDITPITLPLERNGDRRANGE